MLILSKDENISYSGASGEAEEGKTMSTVLPVMFLLIAVLTMVTTMHRLAAKEKTQIGTLKALGFKNRRILAHYTSYALMIGLVRLRVRNCVRLRSSVFHYESERLDGHISRYAVVEAFASVVLLDRPCRHNRAAYGDRIPFRAKDACRMRGGLASPVYP